MITENIKRACAFIQGAMEGTGYLVGSQYVVTCAHLVSRIGSRVTVAFYIPPGSKQSSPVPGTVVQREQEDDCALIKIDEEAREIEPLSLTTAYDPKLAWCAFGYPELGSGVGIPIEGEIRDRKATDTKGQPAIQLFSPDIKGEPPQGWSGSPVVVNNQVIGHLKRCIPDLPDTPAGILKKPVAHCVFLYASPADKVLSMLRKEGLELVKNYGDSIPQIWEAEIFRDFLSREVERCLRRQEPVVLLAPNKAGSHTFLRQLFQKLKEHHSEWEVRKVFAAPCTNESEVQYSQRIERCIDVDPLDTPLVVCIDGFSRLSQELAVSLGTLLRARLEDGIGNKKRKFYLIAVGSYPLFLLRYGGAHSLLNSARQIDLRDWNEAEIDQFLAKNPRTMEPMQNKAKELYEHSGGHPYLLKLILCQWCEHPEREIADLAQEVVHAGDFFMLPYLARHLRNESAVKTLRECLQKGQIPYYPAMFDDPQHKLFFDGFFKKTEDDKFLAMRSSAIGELIREYLERMKGKQA